jgi:hypothetical protein
MSRRPLRALRHQLRPLVSRPLAWIAARIAPPLYLFYMGLVWRTSSVRDHGLCELAQIAAEHDGALALLWHEEVLTVAYGYRRLGVRPHTIASRSDLGEVITRVLERCGFTVFRGGSSRRSSRRSDHVLGDMIRHMQSHAEVVYGLTVDGSHGPAYRMKRGGIVIARACDKPVVLVRTWYRRCLRLRSWDRTAIPLPFNEIHHYLRGPYPVPEDAHTPEGLERFRRRLEEDLIELAARSYRDAGQTRPPDLVPRTAG